LTGSGAVSRAFRSSSDARDSTSTGKPSENIADPSNPSSTGRRRAGSNRTSRTSLPSTPVSQRAAAAPSSHARHFERQTVTSRASPLPLDGRCNGTSSGTWSGASRRTG